MKRISSRAASVALIVAVAVFMAWLSLALTGHRTLVVMSGSMEPLISPGDIAVVKTIKPAEAQVGDVVTFRDPTRGRQLVTHRAVYIRDMGSAYAFATQGDQNSSIEEWTITEDGQIGRMAGSVPALGYVFHWLGSPLVRAAMIAGACLLLGFVAMRSALQLSKTALARSGVAVLVLVLGLGIGLRSFPGTLAAFSSVDDNATSTFQAATSFCPGPGSATLAPNADAWVNEDQPTTNYGTGIELYTDADAAKTQRALIRFTLPSLGACALQSASLEVNITHSHTTNTISAFQLAGGWTETGVTWNNQPAATGTGANITPAFGSNTFNVTSQVQSMYTSANHGLQIRYQTEAGGHDDQVIASRETALGPVLTVTWGP